MLGPLDVVSLSRAVRAGVRPIYGVRLPPGRGASGWYFWAGEPSPRDQRFEPISVAHACALVPELERVLGVAPGYRVRIGARLAPCATSPASSRAR